MAQCVRVATHSWPGRTDSGLDHIYTNQPDKLGTPVVQFRGGSDHRLIFVVRHCKSIRENIRYCKKRSYKEFSEKKFLAEVEKISWWDIYSTTDFFIK